jgi:hypothetical protein
MPNARLPVFEKFIGDLRAVWSAETDEARRMDKAKTVLQHMYDPKAQTVVEQYGPTQIPYDLLV